MLPDSPASVATLLGGFALTLVAIGCTGTDASVEAMADPAGAGSVVLVHGSIVSMTRDSVLRDWTLVLADGEIVEHLREPAPSLALFPANGVTTVVNLEGQPSHLALRDSVLDHDLFAPRILSSGPFIDRIVSSPQEARREVRRVQAAGYDLIKIHGDMEERTFAATIDEANRLNLPVIGHYPGDLATPTVLDGLDALAHAEELLGPEGFASDHERR